MWGTIVNLIAIISGSIIGLALKGEIPKKFQTTIINEFALCVILIGISGSIKFNNMILRMEYISKKASQCTKGFQLNNIAKYSVR